MILEMKWQFQDWCPNILDPFAPVKSPKAFISAKQQGARPKIHSAILDDWAVFSLNQVLVLGPSRSQLVFAKRAKSKKSVRGSSEAHAVCGAPGRLVAVDMNIHESHGIRWAWFFCSAWWWWYPGVLYMVVDGQSWAYRISVSPACIAIIDTIDSYSMLFPFEWPEVDALGIGNFQKTRRRHDMLTREDEAATAFWADWVLIYHSLSTI